MRVGEPRLRPRKLNRLGFACLFLGAGMVLICAGGAVACFALVAWQKLPLVAFARVAWRNYRAAVIAVPVAAGIIWLIHRRAG